MNTNARSFFCRRFCLGISLLSATLIVAVAIAQSPPGDAQPPAPAPSQAATATVSYSNGASLNIRCSHEGKSPLTAISPGETVHVQVRFASSLNSASVLAQALDGGTILSNQQSASVAADGTVGVDFQAPSQPGMYRVALTAPGTSAILNFWVANSQSPNAAALTP
ncbi:MAG: hypothetical protein M3Y27_09305 [Acidobacteriota bacterium]|nr:hypothetical protein [Acidobacteriota bacterium]